ncbi:hypothetical protein CAEBREN_24146 [Caenorhabditis brenneri]|uniref:EGF-like domain-containing protein n=1 Tax=Caenorhabditis brenneri TaxID=135651 RepID=G0N1V6_CAEBE|nr:hypothetical protein CAEBREN_24146 [Caenorhabditis brenneri]
MISMEACLHQEPCVDIRWATIATFEAQPDEAFEYEHHYNDATMPKGFLKVTIKNPLDEDDIFLPEQDIAFLLNREPQNFTLTTNDNSTVEISVRNKCDFGYYRNECNVWCNVKPETNYYCDYYKGQTCKDGWGGMGCDRPVCDLKCNLRGRCVAPNKCKCFHGYLGDQCTECLVKEGCQNGTCEVVNGWTRPSTCKCHEGFYGDLCDKVDMCFYARPCRNGVCNPTNTTDYGFQCSCDQGYTGIRCDKSVQEFDCSLDDVCKNGGTCIQFENVSRCRCPIGFSGKRCEQATGAVIPTSDSTTNQVIHTTTTPVPTTLAIPTLSTKDCTKKCREGYMCIMGKRKPVCVNTENPGPLVTYKKNNGTVIYQIYYGMYHWKVKDAPLNIEKALEKAVAATTMQVWRVEDDDDFFPAEDDYDYGPFGRISF